MSEQNNVQSVVLTAVRQARDAGRAGGLIEACEEIRAIMRTGPWQTPADGILKALHERLLLRAEKALFESRRD